jgi:branched-chain amino acid transport system substrate-binding protein
MRATPVEDFFSRHGRLREDGLMVHDLYLMQVKKPEDSRQAWDYYQVLATIPGEQAFPTSDPACALNKK